MICPILSAQFESEFLESGFVENKCMDDCAWCLQVLDKISNRRVTVCAVAYLAQQHAAVPSDAPTRAEVDK